MKTSVYTSLVQNGSLNDAEFGNVHKYVFIEILLIDVSVQISKPKDFLVVEMIICIAFNSSSYLFHACFTYAMSGYAQHMLGSHFMTSCCVAFLD